MNPDVNNVGERLIGTSGFQFTDHAGDVDEGARRPVVLVFDLHFNVDPGMIVELEADIQDNGFFIRCVACDAGIFKFNRLDISRL